MSHPLCKLVGKHLVRMSSGRRELTSQLKKKKAVLALFFNCSEELPDENKDTNICTRLADFHMEMNGKGISFEVIQISVESEGKAVAAKFPFEQKELPFLTLDPENAEKIQGHLFRKYGVLGQTPKPVILIDSSSGEVINFQGREKLLEDPKGSQFPWRHPTCTDILESGQLVRFSKNLTAIEAANVTHIKDCIKGIYFGAFWCPAARSFLPHLVEIYNKINSRKKTFEIIFVSSDRSQESFERFLSSTPFLAVPYSDTTRRECLTHKYNIKAIPSLCIIGSDDTIISSDGRLEILDDPEAEDFPWYPKLVNELRDKHSSKLNHELCVIYFLGNDENEYDQVEISFNSIAKYYEESEIPTICEPKFFISTDNSELAESLRIFIDLEESLSYLVIMDVPNCRYAVTSASSTQIPLHDESFVKDFLHKFLTLDSQIDLRKINGRFL